MPKEIKIYSFDELERDVQIKVVESNKERILTIINNYVRGEWWTTVNNLKNWMDLNFPWVVLIENDDEGDVLGATIEMDLSDCPGWMFKYMQLHEYAKTLHEHLKSDGIWKKYKESCVSMDDSMSLIVFIRKFLMTCADNVTDWVLKMRFDTNYAVDYLLGCYGDMFVKTNRFFGNRMFTEFGDAVRVSKEES